MTSTTVINAVSVGSGANPPFTNASQTSLQTGTTAFCVSAKLTNGAAAGNLNECIKLYIVSSPFNEGSAVMTLNNELAKDATIIEVKPASAPNLSRITSTALLPRLGDYVYVWAEEGTLRTPATLSAVLYEIN